MANDLEIIKRLEKRIGYNIKVFTDSTSPNNKEMSSKRLFSLRSWCILRNDQVVALNLSQAIISPDGSRFGVRTLSSFPSEILLLKNIQFLCLMSLGLKRLPKELFQTGLDLLLNVTVGEYEAVKKGILLDGNPLESPPLEIVKKGREAVLEYFKSLEAEKLPLNEVKVLLVGDGGAGKTSLVRQLMGKSFRKSESQTHGINITPWLQKCEDTYIKAHLWDFGGQEIMHATHQFFLSRRSLYILVLDGRKEEKAEYWLKHIESFGGDSPILVVINKIDENPGFDVNRNFLQHKYKGIKGFFRISCFDKSGIKEFCEALITELGRVEMLKTTWAKSWFDVKTTLETMKKDFITYDEYNTLCKQSGVDTQGGRDTLIDFLNDLGVVLHFRDFELEDTHVLEPRWVTGAVYRIINSNILADNKGLLKLEHLPAILKKKRKTDPEYPRDKHRYIVDLMKKFELCYKIDDSTVLIPDLLEVQQPKFEFDFENRLQFYFNYDFLPRSVMPRFIVRMHKDIKENLRWRTGVVLEDIDFRTTAVVISDDEARKIHVYVSGEQCRDYFSVILFTFREINSSFQQLKVVERVPMPDNPDISVSYNHLVNLKLKGIEKYIPEGSEVEYNVKKLLGTIRIESSEEQLLRQILEKLRDENDTLESLLNKANSYLMVQPNVLGLGININNIVKDVFGKRKPKKETKSS